MKARDGLAADRRPPALHSRAGLCWTARAAAGVPGVALYHLLGDPEPFGCPRDCRRTGSILRACGSNAGWRCLVLLSGDVDSGSELLRRCRGRRHVPRARSFRIVCCWRLLTALVPVRSHRRRMPSATCSLVVASVGRQRVRTSRLHCRRPAARVSCCDPSWRCAARYQPRAPGDPGAVRRGPGRRSPGARRHAVEGRAPDARHLPWHRSARGPGCGARGRRVGLHQSACTLSHWPGGLVPAFPAAEAPVTRWCWRWAT